MSSTYELQPFPSLSPLAQVYQKFEIMHQAEGLIRTLDHKCEACFSTGFQRGFDRAKFCSDRDREFFMCTRHEVAKRHIIFSTRVLKIFYALLSCHLYSIQ